MFSQIRAILPGDTGDQCFFNHSSLHNITYG
jgi:hypothetical protein